MILKNSDLNRIDDKFLNKLENQRQSNRQDVYSDSEQQNFQRESCKDNQEGISHVEQTKLEKQNDQTINDEEEDSEFFSQFQRQFTKSGHEQPPKSTNKNQKSLLDDLLTDEIANNHNSVKNLNSLTVVSDLIDSSGSKLTFKTSSQNRQQEAMHEGSSSILSPSSSSSNSSSLDSSTNTTANNRLNFDSSTCDANPRKNSPIPASPPSNLDLDANENSSLSSLNNLNVNFHSAFTRFNELDKITSIKNLNAKADSTKGAKHYTASEYSNNRSNAAAALASTNVDPISSLKNNQKNQKISTCLDKWYRELKGQILSEFEKSRLQLLQEQQKTLIEEKEKQATEITKLKRELEFQKESIRMYELNLLKKDETIDNLTKTLDKQREKTDLHRSMMEWKITRLETEKEAFTSKLAEKFYSNRLKLKTFLSWQYFLINKYKSKVEKACKKKAEEVCYDLATKYECKIKKLEEELNVSRLEIEKYKVEMSRHEEHIKKALMRGVCALNLEAMSIFNEQSVKDQTDLEDKQQLSYSTRNRSSSHSTTKMDDILRSSEKSSRDLARKVKNFCETSFNSTRPTNDHAEQSGMSELARAKLKLLNTANSGAKMTSNDPGSYEPHELTNPTSSKFTSNNKIYDELIEHSLNIQPKITPKHSNIKSKIGSLPSSRTQEVTEAQQQPGKHKKTTAQGTTMAAYRSVIIEKHTTSNNTRSDAQKQQHLNTEGSVKSIHSKVKFTPPMQPATVVNTIITK